MSFIVGSNNYDFEELQTHTEYLNGYKKDHKSIVYFWEVVSEFPLDAKKKLLSDYIVIIILYILYCSFSLSLSSSLLLSPPSLSPPSLSLPPSLPLSFFPSPSLPPSLFLLVFWTGSDRIPVTGIKSMNVCYNY